MGKSIIYSVKGKSSNYCLCRELVAGGSQSGVFVNSALENSGDEPDPCAGLGRKSEPIAFSVNVGGTAGTQPVPFQGRVFLNIWRCNYAGYKVYRAES
jgi:hypothetical protein